MLQVLMAPTRGWEDVGADGTDARTAFRSGLVPLVAIAALTVGVGAFYELHPSAGALIIKAIAVFARYMIAYFCGIALLTFALPKLAINGAFDRNRTELFCAYCTAIMATIGILQNLLPMDHALLQFMPIYVVVVICLGRSFLSVDESNIFRFAAVSIVGLILPVYVIDWLLMPAA